MNNAEDISIEEYEYHDDYSDANDMGQVDVALVQEDSQYTTSEEYEYDNDIENVDDNGIAKVSPGSIEKQNEN